MIKNISQTEKIETSNTLFDLMVIGGGASGLMAAGKAGERGLKVLLLEKNKNLGDKILITGGGRCNITNNEEDVRVLLKKYGRAEPFLYSIFSQFGVKDTFSFFEGHNLPLITEAQKRVFPKTQKASDVVLVLEKYLASGNVVVQKSTPVTKILIDKNKITGVLCGHTEYQAKSYLFATGCMSHSETGSTGDGFKWLKELGHSVVESTPTIVPLRVSDLWVKSLSGVSVSDIAITFYVDNKKQFKLKGKILFTHFGLSGPLILNSAQKVSDLLHKGIVTASIDMYPDLNLAELEHKIIDIFDANKNKTLKNIIKKITKEAMGKGLLVLLDEKIDTSIKVNLITKEKRKIIVHLLKSLPVTVEGLMGFDRAVIADGGVPLEEIDMKTMCSKKIKNLFVTGDLLHINRPSGGYSLQLCWSTGYVAGSNA